MILFLNVTLFLVSDKTEHTFNTNIMNTFKVVKLLYSTEHKSLTTLLIMALIPKSSLTLYRRLVLGLYEFSKVLINPLQSQEILIVQESC